MAIAFGAVSARINTSGTGPTVTGSGTYGIVFAFGDTGGTDNISGVTWGGVAMTKLGTSVQTPGDRWNSAWGILAPASAATITVSGGTIKSFIPMYYTGVNQTVAADSYNTNTSSASASITVTNTVVASNCWTIIYQKDVNAYTYTTDVGVMRVASSGGGEAIADSNGSVGTGSQSMTLTTTGGNTVHGGIMISLAPIPPTGPVNVKTINGLTIR